MADPEIRLIPPLRRPTLLLALFGSTVAVILGFTGGDERALLVPVVVSLLWAAAYRAQPAESTRIDNRRSPGAVVVRRTPPSPARPRKLMPPAPSRLSPAAAVAASDAKERKSKRPGERLYVPVKIGLPDLPEGKEKKKRRSRAKRKGGDGDPTLGL